MRAIPADWTVEPFAAVARYSSGRTPARANQAYWNGTTGTPWVSIADMKPYGVLKRTKETITELALADVFRGRIVPAGTLLMSFKLTIGRVATLGIRACHNEAIISIIPRADIDQRFLGYYLSQVDYSELQDRQVKGQTLNRDKIDRIPVTLPPPAERGAIADVLDRVREAIVLQARGAALAAELKAAAMHEFFTRGLRGEAQKDTEIGLVPQSWSPRTVLELCEIWSGGTPRKSIAAYWGGDVPWVSGKDLKAPTLDDTIDHLAPAGVESGSRLAPADAVLLLVRGMGLARDLPVAVIRRPMAFNQDVKALVSRGRYSGSFLRSAVYQGKERLLSKVVPSAHGTMTLNLDDVENFMIACPDNPDEAEEIASILGAMDHKIDLHCRMQLMLEDLFRSLLGELMAGAVRVADLDLSALSAVTATGATS